jgi:hypothetical protein
MARDIKDLPSSEERIDAMIRKQGRYIADVIGDIDPSEHPAWAELERRKAASGDGNVREVTR